MDKKTQTVQTYNRSAMALAGKFDRMGARSKDIDETFALVEKENPKVLEIGCGNGRDAEYILEKTNDYLGTDISEELIKLAREKVPQAEFEVADVTSFEFPAGLDIVFAFASLIHVTKEEFSIILHKLSAALDDGGVIRISLKYNDHYIEVDQQDEFGDRTYYHYSEQDIRELAQNFKVLKMEVIGKSGTDAKWIEVLLQK